MIPPLASKNSASGYLDNSSFVVPTSSMVLPLIATAPLLKKGFSVSLVITVPFPSNNILLSSLLTIQRDVDPLIHELLPHFIRKKPLKFLFIVLCLWG